MPEGSEALTDHVEAHWCFDTGDQVDAFIHGAWRRGTVAGVFGGSKYSVLLADEVEREIICRRFNLRPNGDSPPLRDQEEPSTTVESHISAKLKFVFGKKHFTPKFESGTIVEVTSEEDGYKESWYAAKIIGSIRTDKFLVDYQDLVTEDRLQLLKEEAEARHVRPEPPLVPSVPYFEKLQRVDARYNDGWWEGVVSEIQPGGRYIVYFRSTYEEMLFKHSELRPHQDWIDGKWVIDSKENSSKAVLKSHCADMELWKTKLNLGEGMNVEVRSDEEGYRGSWYAAKIIASLPNDKFLVEYKTLFKSNDETELLKEEANGRDIRPCPPETGRVYPFAVWENVDAWFNDGWWSGHISKVVSGSKYAVYFSTTKEELEFHHCYLRPHQEWVDGKWIYSHML